LPGKYEALRSRLATADKTAGQLVMSWAEIEQLVGMLPGRANSGNWWLVPAPTTAHARAWLAAGWQPQSVVPGNSVVFVPSAATPPQHSQAAGSTALGSVPNAVTSHKTTWRSLAADIKGWAVAAVSAGVATAVSFKHLPWYATTVLGVAIAAVAFATTQAFSSGSKAEEARKWWAATSAMLVLIAGGTFAYHQWLDPSTRPGPPFAVTVDPDPTSLVSPQGCRQMILPGPWSNPAPPASLLQEIVNPWEQSQHGVDATTTYVAIFLQGTSDQAVEISSPEIIVTRRKAALRGPAVQLGGGCGSEQAERKFNANLDQQYPAAVFEDGQAFPAVKTAAGTAQEAQSPFFKITASDSEYFVISASTSEEDVQWYIDLDWASDGQKGTYQIRDGPVPFETSAYDPSVNPTYTLLPNGTWSPSLIASRPNPTRTTT
jgi:hypothetical protein